MAGGGGAGRASERARGGLSDHAPARAREARPTGLRRRSLAKAVSWRLVGTLDTLLLAFLTLTFLGPLFGLEAGAGENAATAGSIALAELVTKIVLYYLHERAWERVDWNLRPDGRDGHARTTAKTASWRVLASLDTTLLAFLFTGSGAAALSIGGLEVVTKLGLYYLHERAWARLRWGT